MAARLNWIEVKALGLAVNPKKEISDFPYRVQKAPIVRVQSTAGNWYLMLELLRENPQLNQTKVTHYKK